MTLTEKYLNLNYLIDRAYVELKKDKKQKKGFIKPEILNHNRKSYVSNFIKFCNSINRDPEDVRKFINKDMGVDVSFISENNLDNIDNNLSNRTGLKFNNMYKQAHILNCITNYMKQFVICEICKSGDTEIKKIDRINFICCNSCKGQRSTNN